jgi:hypothetical protein
LRKGSNLTTLSNIFLHHVLDKWFEDVVRPRLKGKATLVPFADDFVMTFETYSDAKRVMGVLGKRLGRLGRFGLLSQACDNRPNQKHRVMRRKLCLRAHRSGRAVSMLLAIMRGDGGRFMTLPPLRPEARSRLGW